MINIKKAKEELEFNREQPRATLFDFAEKMVEEVEDLQDKLKNKIDSISGRDELNRDSLQYCKKVAFRLLGENSAPDTVEGIVDALADKIEDFGDRLYADDSDVEDALKDIHEYCHTKAYRLLGTETPNTICGIVDALLARIENISTRLYDYEVKKAVGNINESTPIEEIQNLNEEIRKVRSENSILSVSKRIVSDEISHVLEHCRQRAKETLSSNIKDDLNSCKIVDAMVDEIRGLRKANQQFASKYFTDKMLGNDIDDEIEEAINIVFAEVKGSPDLTFVEVEDDNGNSINVGRWINNGNGGSTLRISTIKRKMTEKEKIVAAMCKDAGVGFGMGEHGKAEDFFAKLADRKWKKS